MMTPDTLGQRLRARRTELGLTLANVAERAGLSLPYVSNLERGRGNPTMDVLRALANALDTPLGAIIGDEFTYNPLQAALAEAPPSLVRFAKSERFEAVVQHLAAAQSVDLDEMRSRILIGMAAAPRRSSKDPTEDDWRRLVDVYSLILGS